MGGVKKRQQQQPKNRHDTKEKKKSPLNNHTDGETERPIPEKTLYQLIEERELLKKKDSTSSSSAPEKVNLNESNITYMTIDPNDGTLSPSPRTTTTTIPSDTSSSFSSTSPTLDDYDPPPLLSSLLLSLPLSTIHFTLTLLCHHQYLSTPPPLPSLILTTLLTVFPFLTFLIHLFHGHLLPASLRHHLRVTPSWLLQTLYFGSAVFAGGYLIHITNEAGYYAVMKRAPAVGTVWVWCVIEIRNPGWAVMAVGMPMGWAVGWMGYGLW